MSAQQEAPTHSSLIIRVASKSNIKLSATELAMRAMFPGRSIQVLPSPVELQVQSDDVNAQPIGEAETARYARARLTALRSQHDDADAYIAIESGARPGELGLADACDFAIILIQNRNGSFVELQTKAIDFPELHAGSRVIYPLVEAKQRGFKSTTGGDIIHEVLPNVPGDDWQGRFPNSDQGYSRLDQIREAMSINATGIQRLFDRRLSQATTLDG